MAYGAIAAPKLADELPVFSYPLAGGAELTTHAIHGEASEEVMRYFHTVFEAELEEGRTYPQEGPMGYEGYKAYFFSSTTIIGVVHPAPLEKLPASLEEAIGGRSIEEAIGGCNYIQIIPDALAILSHLHQKLIMQNCNAGFLVPPVQRGKKVGSALAKAFLEYAPRLGYRASVFNLVYDNNYASLKLWDNLGFKRVGLIPGAGRLRTKDGKGEEYVDAVVIHKSFV